jgi:hypothetical protein
LIGHLTKLAETQGRIFGGLPYRKFVYFYFFRPTEASATVLEHQNSYVAVWYTGAQSLPDDMVVQASHEFFHVWNVKRIRPVQMWPYDYARENETPLLWVSEVSFAKTRRHSVGTGRHDGRSQRKPAFGRSTLTTIAHGAVERVGRGHPDLSADRRPYSGSRRSE